MLSRRYLHLLQLLLILSFMTSCATTKRPSYETTPTKDVQSIHSWTMSGAIAAKNQQKGWTASFNWIQQGQDEYQIRLFGPIGSGTAIINRKNGLTTYHDAKQETSSHNAEQLLKQKTGISLPIQNLYYWMRGLPAPGPVTLEKRDAQHHLQLLEQSGYKIEYINSMQVNRMSLPQQIKLTNSTIQIKIVIKQWSI